MVGCLCPALACWVTASLETPNKRSSFLTAEKSLGYLTTPSQLTRNAQTWLNYCHGDARTRCWTDWKMSEPGLAVFQIPTNNFTKEEDAQGFGNRIKAQPWSDYLNCII